MDRTELYEYIIQRQQALREASKDRKYEVRQAGDNFPDHTLATAFQHFMRDVFSKAREARDKYNFPELGWATPGWQPELQAGIAEHLLKGDPRDVAVYAMFAWFHGWSTATPAAPASASGAAAGATQAIDDILATWGTGEEETDFITQGDQKDVKRALRQLRATLAHPVSSLPLLGEGEAAAVRAIAAQEVEREIGYRPDTPAHSHTVALWLSAYQQGKQAAPAASVVAAGSGPGGWPTPSLVGGGGDGAGAELEKLRHYVAALLNDLLNHPDLPASIQKVLWQQRQQLTVKGGDRG